MEPIRFSCECKLSVPRRSIFDGIEEPAAWRSFTGYGLLPGIESVRYLKRDEGMQGATIAVMNKDGSSHEENIELWQPYEAIEMRLHKFSKPLAFIASHFLENWEFAEREGSDYVVRSFRMFPRRGIHRPILWFISLLMRRAILRHLRALARA